jgi:tight adherence protein B
MLLMSFIAGVLAVVGAYSVLSDLFMRDRSRVSKRIDDQFRRQQRERARKALLFKNLAKQASEANPEGQGQFDLVQRVKAMLEQSGLELTPRRLLLLTVAAGLAGAALPMLFFHNGLMAAIGALVAVGLPALYVQQKRKARLSKMLAQLPDALDLMARVIRSGQTMSQALQAVADEFDVPIAGEFAYCFEQQNLGLAPELALRDLARRAGLLEIKIFVLAMLVQQQTGGNLAELLDKLATMVRERFKLRGKISAATAEGRLQALILLALPPVLGLLVLALNRDYGAVLLEHYYLLVYMLISELIGAVWIRRIVNFDF